MKMAKLPKNLQRRAHKLKKHPVFPPCQAANQIGLILIHWERATIVECCLFSSAIIFILVTIFACDEVADFDVE